MNDILEHIIKIKRIALNARRELRRSNLETIRSEIEAIILLDIEELKLIRKDHGDSRLLKHCKKVFRDAKRALKSIETLKAYKHAGQLFLEIERIEVLEYRLLNVKHISHELILPIEFRNGVKQNDPIIIKYIRLMKKVPEHLRLIMAKRGAYIVFFNGPLTDNREWADQKGMRPPQWTEHTWDGVIAGHQPNSRGIFIGIHGDYVAASVVDWDPCLHEFGHSFSQRIGEQLYRKPLSDVRVVLQAVIREPFKDNYFNQPEEYVANSVDMFYRSKRTRKRLEKCHLIVYEFLMNIEQRTK